MTLHITGHMRNGSPLGSSCGFPVLRLLGPARSRFAAVGSESHNCFGYESRFDNPAVMSNMQSGPALAFKALAAPTGERSSALRCDREQTVGALTARAGASQPAV